MINIKTILALLFILSTVLPVHMAYGNSRVSLNAIQQNQNYQVRVRTGNLDLDRRIYDAAADILSKYLPISDKKSVTGYIDVTFSSTLGQGFLGSKPAYPSNVVYGSKWYTPDTVNKEISSVEFESNEGGVLRWQKSHMAVTIRDLKNNKLWSAEYTYKGMQDITGLMNKINEGANLCLDRIAGKFKSEFQTGPEFEEKRRKKLPSIALIVKDRWENAGKNRLGHTVSVDSHSVTYPAPGIISAWVRTGSQDVKFIDLIEIHCKNKTFRYSKNRSENPSPAPRPEQWTVISPESAPELVHLLLCVE